MRASTWLLFWSSRWRGPKSHLEKRVLRISCCAGLIVLYVRACFCPLMHIRKYVVWGRVEAVLGCSWGLDLTLENLLLVVNVFPLMTFSKSTTFCNGYATRHKSFERSLRIRLVDSIYWCVVSTRKIKSPGRSSIPSRQRSFARQHGPAECAKRLNNEKQTS